MDNTTLHIAGIVCGFLCLVCLLRRNRREAFAEILALLQVHGPMTGREMVTASDELGRCTIYLYLFDLENLGLIHSTRLYTGQRLYYINARYEATLKNASP